MSIINVSKRDSQENHNDFEELLFKIKSNDASCEDKLDLLDDSFGSWYEADEDFD